MFIIDFYEGVAKLWRKTKKKGWYLKEYKIYADKHGAFVIKNLSKVYLDRQDCIVL